MNRKEPHAHIRLILADIRMCQSEEGQDPSYLDMMTDIVISPKTIAKILLRLQAFGDLRIERRAGSRNHYIIQEKPGETMRNMTQTASHVAGTRRVHTQRASRYFPNREVTIIRSNGTLEIQRQYYPTQSSWNRIRAIQRILLGDTRQGWVVIGPSISINGRL